MKNQLAPDSPQSTPKPEAEGGCAPAPGSAKWVSHRFNYGHSCSVCGYHGKREVGRRIHENLSWPDCKRWTKILSPNGWEVCWRDMVRRFAKWKYVILTHKDYAARLNRSVEVEQALMDCAAGKRPALSKDECRQLAVKLGVPECFRSPNVRVSASGGEKEKI